MSAATNVFENQILNHFLRNTAQTPASTLYLALLTGVSDAEAGTVTEVSTSGTGYARKAISFAAPSGGQVANDAEIIFDEATANWGTVTHFAICDSASGGNILIVGALSASRAYNTGDQAVVNAGAITVSAA